MSTTTAAQLATIAAAYGEDTMTAELLVAAWEAGDTATVEAVRDALGLKEWEPLGNFLGHLPSAAK